MSGKIKHLSQPDYVFNALFFFCVRRILVHVCCCMVCMRVQGYAFRVCHHGRIRVCGLRLWLVRRTSSMVGCLVVVRLCCLGILLSSSGRGSLVCLSSGFLWLVVMVGQGQRSIDTDAQAEGHRSVVLKVHDRVGWFVSPTILTHVSSGKPV